MKIRIFYLVLFALFLVGCGNQPKPLYSWDAAYIDSIYKYLIEEDLDIDSRISILENAADRANKGAVKAPPGLYAHIGLLYLNKGNIAQAKIYFNKESEEFKESREYMKFLLEQNTVKQNTIKKDEL